MISKKSILNRVQCEKSKELVLLQTDNTHRNVIISLILVEAIVKFVSEAALPFLFVFGKSHLRQITATVRGHVYTPY